MTKTQILTNIAKKHCFVETLESRGCDDYDFHDIGVRNLKAALEDAYESGRQSKNNNNWVATRQNRNSE